MFVGRISLGISRVGKHKARCAIRPSFFHWPWTKSPLVRDVTGRIGLEDGVTVMTLAVIIDCK